MNLTLKFADRKSRKRELTGERLAARIAGMIGRLMAFMCVAGTVSGAVVIEPVPVTGKIEWVYSYAEGKKLARETGKPMFVVFRCER